MGKYPRRFENLRWLEGVLNFKFCVARLSSRATVKPSRVTNMAVVFRYIGIVICGIVWGVMLFEIRNPAKMLPTKSRLIGLISVGLFSLMGVSDGKRGWPSRAK